MKSAKENSYMHISTGTIVRTVLVLVGFYVLYLLNDLLLVLLTSIVVASSVEPAARWFMARKLPRTLAVLAVYIIFLSLFASLFYFFLPPLLKDFSQFFSSLPRYFDFLDKWNPWSDVMDYQQILTNIAANFTGGVSALGGAADAAGGIVRTVGGVFRGLANFILVIVISFYLAVQEKGIENFLKIIVPQKNEKYVIDLWYRSQHKIGRWMQGQVILGVLVGVLVYLGLLIMGVQHAFLLAIVAATFELIPVFGPTLAAVPAVLIGFTSSVTLGLMVIAFYIIIQQFENHLIYPIVVRKVVGVPPILVIIALLIGLKLAGFMGIILSVPLAAALMEFVNDIEKKKALEIETA
ncbi:MAG: AI-2E family transporter [Parcubacteria group bacterium]|nr:AI-2E family transporter [Parcubacteria group bacterium]